MTDIVPLDPPAMALARAAVDPNEARLTRRIGRGLVLPLGDGATLQVAFDAATPATDGEALQLQGPYGTLYLADGVTFLRTLTGVDVGPGLDGWLHASVLGRLQGGPFATTQRVAPATDVSPDGVALRLTLQEDGHALGTTASAGAATWCALLAAAPFRPVPAPAEPFLALLVRLPVPLASHRLQAAALGALAPGDVLLPDRARIGVDGTGWLAWPGHRAHVRHGAAGTLEILTLQTGEAAMEEQGEAVAGGVEAGAEAAALDGTALRIDFRLGTLALTLGELRTLGAGTVLELADGGAGAIAIACGGKVLGQGEAVDVGGRLGIRITRWDAPC
ncbi:type III secretion protein Q [Pseudoduganella flava]|uniref:Type III secretion protein Q n=1 Tax=Pseudoduganella flava TaxID=871742 RepID=A0A562PE37_9BURK|nr:FliM/FliN family flagellar motor switch protein [Pseudoduganella flava]QGZ42137.1 hypothetical protein GO485_25895 [Pseudoduganella flava]TWI42490.1 type III secretion protein Q [Pseudoduganella flava]